jgi:hypothetical protein
MTAMRVAHDHDPSKVSQHPNEVPGSFRNPASSYQTATPQQLQAAGIQPVVVNDRHLPRQKSSTLNSFPVYNANAPSYQEPHASGHNRAYAYDDNLARPHVAAPPVAMRGSSDSPALGAGMSTSSYAKANSTAGHTLSASFNSQPGHRSGAPQINSVEVRRL